MRVRDAIEADAAALADLRDRPTDAIVEMIHQRTVVVGEHDGEPGEDREHGGEPGADGGTDAGRDADRGKTVSRSESNESDDRSPRNVMGFVAFDATDDRVHVTSFAGSPSTIERLLEVPKRFARRESMDLEVVVVDNDPERVEPVERAGFVPVGDGPRFGGQTTTTFRLDVEQLDEE